MEMKSRGRWMASLLALGFLVGSTGLAQATLVDFQTAVQAEAALTNSYTFDGSPLLDSKGSDNLSNVGAVTYGTGYGTSAAAETSAGNALRSFSHPLAAAHTVEYIFKTDDKTAGGFVTAAFAPGTDGRLYYGKQGTDKLELTLGQNTSTDIISTANYNNDDWYYVAVSVEQDGADWVANAWWANLSDVAPTLTQSFTDYTVTPGGATISSLPAIPAPALGIGAGAFGSTGFDGSIDDLNVYSAALSGADLQGHLDAILVAVPEPTSFLLVGMAGLLFWGRTARQNSCR